MKPTTLASLMVATDATMDPALQSLLTRASASEVAACADAMRAAYEAGRRDADRHSSAFVGRVFAALVGIPAGIDATAPDDPKVTDRLRGVLRGMVGR